MCENVWRCAGCGIEGPDTMRRCDCATSVVIRKMPEGQRDLAEWKTDPPCPHCGNPVDLFRARVS